MSLHELHLRYGDCVEFLSIYIREAHPVDGWWLGDGVAGKLIRAVVGSGEATDIYDPKIIEERQTVAGRCETELEYGITTIVDTMDDTVNKAYASLPTRLYLVGEDGRIVYAGGLGPFGFKPTELGETIERYLAEKKKIDA